MIRLILISLLLTTQVEAQSVDSLYGFRHARAFTDQNRTPILIALGAGTITAQGFLHASFYSRDRSYGDIHLASEILGASHYLLLYVGGLDPIQAWGVSLIADVGFQALINASFGLDWDYRPPEYRAGGVRLPRGFLGPAVQIGLGAAMLMYKRVL